MSAWRDPNVLYDESYEPGRYPGLGDALRRLQSGRIGPATDNDRPPPSIFPITRAARAALRYAKQYDQ